jgi:vacuolar protein sorting-associated protein IST1
MLELYCELLLARSQLLDPPSLPHSPPSPHGVAALDPALEEAVRSLIYAAPRTSIKELHQARNLLVEKFGKDVALASMEGEGVAERVLSKLRIDTPEKKLVDAYLSEIARFYGVPFGETEAGEEEDEDDDGEGGGGGIGELAEPTQSNKAGKEKQLELPLEAEPGAGDGDEAIRQREEDEVAELAKATPPRKFGPQSPLRITPPSPSTDNIAPKLRLPGQSDAAKVRKGEVKPSAPAKKKDEGPGGKIPDVDELAKRFAQLKR